MIGMYSNNWLFSAEANQRNLVLDSIASQNADCSFMQSQQFQQRHNLKVAQEFASYRGWLVLSSGDGTASVSVISKRSERPAACHAGVSRDAAHLCKAMQFTSISEMHVACRVVHLEGLRLLPALHHHSLALSTECDVFSVCVTHDRAHNRKLICVSDTQRAHCPGSAMAAYELHVNQYSQHWLLRAY